MSPLLVVKGVGAQTAVPVVPEDPLEVADELLDPEDPMELVLPVEPELDDEEVEVEPLLPVVPLEARCPLLLLDALLCVLALVAPLDELWPLELDAVEAVAIVLVLGWLVVVPAPLEELPALLPEQPAATSATPRAAAIAMRVMDPSSRRDRQQTAALSPQRMPVDEWKGQTRNAGLARG